MLLLGVSMPCGAAESNLEAAVSAAVPRPAAWATPMVENGLSNLFKVNDHLYRGAQPTAEGMKALKKMGIKTVVNLRAFHDDKDLLKGTGLAYERIEFNTWHAEREDIVRFLKIVTDTNNMPVFVHCQHGADRTGTMCAIYRLTVDGWSKEEAIREMTQGGYGFHPVWENLVTFIRGLDVAKLKQGL